MPKIEYVEDSWETEELLESLSPPVRNWFKDKFPDFTDPQKTSIFLEYLMANICYYVHPQVRENT